MDRIQGKIQRSNPGSLVVYSIAKVSGKNT